MKRTSLPRVSKRRPEKRALAARLDRDAANMTLLDVDHYLRLLGPTKNWPFVDDKDAPEVSKWLREQHDCFCWLCGRFRHLDVAHIVPRSDELCNLVLLCSSHPSAGYSDSCHTLTEKNWKLLPLVLKAKLKHDPMHTYFLRIAMLRRQRLGFVTLEG